MYSKRCCVRAKAIRKSTLYATKYHGPAGRQQQGLKRPVHGDTKGGGERLSYSVLYGSHDPVWCQCPCLKKRPGPEYTHLAIPRKYSTQLENHRFLMINYKCF